VDGPKLADGRTEALSYLFYFADGGNGEFQNGRRTRRMTTGALAQARTWYAEARQRAFSWREELPWIEKAAHALALACLTALAAQVRIPLPFTPVPITGQVFAVLLSGVLLGGGYGALSQLFYVGMGAAGVPWYAGFTGGAAQLLGPTGGYLVGFIIAALGIGLVTQKFPFARRFLPQCLLMLAGVGVIYLLGGAYYSWVMSTGLRDTLAQAIVPFIAVDVGKALLAASLSTGLLPQRGG